MSAAKQNQEDLAAPDALAQKALAMVREVARGNGIKTDHYRIARHDIEIVRFMALSRFKVIPKVTEKTVNGRESGEVAGSEQHLRAMIAAASEKVTQGGEPAAHALEAMKARPDLGFGASGLTLPLDSLNKIFVVHRFCTACEGKTSIPCAACKGRGSEHCLKCHGSKDMICPVCRGTQHIQGAGGRQPCLRCNGRGKTGCDACRQSGLVKCRVCAGSGRTPCQPCGATGWKSLVANMSVFVRNAFSWPRESLPPDLANIIDKMGPDIVTQGHARIGLALAPKAPGMAADEFALGYDVRLPWGHIEIETRGEALRGRLFGYRPKLTGIAPFLEDTLARGIAALGKAASGGGNVPGLVRKAVRYRVIGETVIAITRHPRKKALAMMHKRYPIGIQTKTLSDIAHKADFALRHMTRGPRIAGLAGGLIAAGLMDALYLFAGRSLIPAAGLMPELVADIAVMAAGGAFAVLCSRLVAAQAMNRALGKLVSPNKKSELMPKAGRGAVWAYSGAALIFIAVAQIALFAGHAAPAWFSLIGL